MIGFLCLVVLGALAWLALDFAPEPSPPDAVLRVNEGKARTMTTSTYCWKSWNGAVCADTSRMPCGGRRGAIKMKAGEGDTLRFRFQFMPTSKPLLHAWTLDKRGHVEHPPRVEVNMTRSPTLSWKLTLDPPIQVEVVARSSAGDVSYIACIT